MNELVSIITPLHKRTQRDYLARMIDDKVHCMLKAKEYGQDYWDGNRRYGYGGYSYDGRWKPVAEQLITRYNLTSRSKVLDIGCGKAHILFEISKILPGIALTGIDISDHGLADAPDDIRPYLHKFRAQDPLPFEDNSFDLAFSLNTFHNLKLFELGAALKEMNRIAKQKYICVESYRNEQELFNLQCWALTCESFFEPMEWVWLYKQSGYDGDYEFIYME